MTGHRTLYEFQDRDSDYLARTLGATYYVGDTGVGKTLIAISAVRKIRTGDPSRKLKVLVLCPAVARRNWAREIEMEHPGEIGMTVRAHVIESDKDIPGKIDPRFSSYWVIAGYPAISLKQSAVLDWLRGVPWDVVICDEAHFLKSADANRTKAVFGAQCDGTGGLMSRADWLWLLSATPMPNHAGELWPFLRATNPDCLPEGALSRTGFEDMFCQVRMTRVRSKWGGETEVRTIQGSKSLPALRSRIGGLFLKRRKADVLSQLPALRVVHTELSAQTTTRYVNANAALSLRGTQIGAGPILRDDDLAELAKLAPASERLALGLAKAPAVVDHVRMLLNGGEPKVVLFAWHKDVLAELYAGLSDFSPVMISGDSPPEHRQRVVDGFQTDPKLRVFLGQIAAAGTAITLTAAARVVFAEAAWTPADNYQALSRCHRIGQTRGVIAEFLSLPGSMDRRIHEVLARKTREISELF